MSRTRKQTKRSTAPEQQVPDLAGRPADLLQQQEHDTDHLLNREQIDRDIAAGATAFQELLKDSSRDWQHWSSTILGLRGLRALAVAKAGTSDMKTQAYRSAMSSLLVMSKYSIYDQIDKQTRSDCYAMMDRLEDVDIWYDKLSTDDKLRWKHPSTIAKHVPKEYLAGGMRRHNQQPKGKKKPLINAETERLKALLVDVIMRLVKHEPESIDLLKQVHPSDFDMEDDVPDLVGPGGNSEQQQVVQP